MGPVHLLDILYHKEQHKVLVIKINNAHLIFTARSEKILAKKRQNTMANASSKV